MFVMVCLALIVNINLQQKHIYRYVLYSIYIKYCKSITYIILSKVKLLLI